MNVSLVKHRSAVSARVHKEDVSGLHSHPHPEYLDVAIANDIEEIGHFAVLRHRHATHLPRAPVQNYTLKSCIEVGLSLGL